MKILEKLNKDWDEELKKAVEERDFDLLIEAIRSGGDIDANDIKGNTPLHKAAMDDDILLCKVLIKAGAKINSENKDGNTPLHNAVLQNNTKVYPFLLGLGADLLDGTLNNPVRTAALQDNNEAYEALGKAGADQTKRNNKGKIDKNRKKPYEEILSEMTYYSHFKK